MKRHIYLVSQDENYDYDTFDSFVVVANSEVRARYTHPSSGEVGCWNGQTEAYDTWAPVEYVTIERIGTADPGMEEGIVCSSFNAG